MLDKNFKIASAEIKRTFGTSYILSAIYNAYTDDDSKRCEIYIRASNGSKPVMLYTEAVEEARHLLNSMYKLLR